MDDGGEVFENAIRREPVVEVHVVELLLGEERLGVLNTLSVRNSDWKQRSDLREIPEPH